MTDNNTTSNLQADDYGDEWLVRVWVQPSVLRSITGNRVKGLREREGAPDKIDLDMDRDCYLTKGFGCFVPKLAGVYNITTWGGEVDEKGNLIALRPNSTQVLVDGEGDHATIRKMGYVEVLSHFGNEGAANALRSAKRATTTVVKAG